MQNGPKIKEKVTLKKNTLIYILRFKSCVNHIRGLKMISEKEREDQQISNIDKKGI